MLNTCEHGIVLNCFFLPGIQLLFFSLYPSLKIVCYLVVLSITVRTLEKQSIFDRKSSGAGITATQVLFPASPLVMHLTLGQ